MFFYYDELLELARTCREKPDFGPDDGVNVKKLSHMSEVAGICKCLDKLDLLK